jgi:ATP-binding cassette subfamily B protein
MTRRIPAMRQMEVADCGAVCLAMVLAHFGKVVRVDELRQTTGSGRGGVDATAIIRTARSYGLTARGVAADLDTLGHLPSGSILHWDFSHFVVLDRVTRNGVEILDPAQGRRRVPAGSLGKHYTGVAIILEPSESFQPSGTRTKGTWKYLRPLLGQSRALTGVLAVSILLRLFALALPIVTGFVVDEIAPRDDRHLLFVLAAVVAAVIVYYVVASLVRGHALLHLRTRLDVSLTTGFVDHLVDLPYGFFLQRSAGDLMMRLQSNANVREILTTGALSALLDGSLATLYLVVLFAVSAPVALLVLVLALLEVAVLATTWRRNERLMAESLHVEATASSYAYELLAGIETLKASGAEHQAAAHWEGLFVDQVNVALARGRLGATVDALVSTLRMASPLLILLFGALQVVNGRMSLGTMLAVAALAAGFLEPLATLVATGLQVQLLGSYMERVNDVLDTPREQDEGQFPPAPVLSGYIRAEQLEFAYSALAPAVVKGVSLEIEPGQHVAIVGRSGSGKSTLAHLLLGLYTPGRGRVLFDGLDLAQFDVRSVRRQLGIVTQRPYLFGASIRENIALTDPDLPFDSVVEAAKMACIHAEIELMPLGYDTPLLDAGSSLSGGQHQRVALARALVHRPAIVLLDEATSELDTITEQHVYQNLASLACTTVVIAHRLSTIANADVIIVMDDGRIVERGTHRELITTGGLYHELVTAQANLQVAPAARS